jgi:hypothetical protein
MSGAKISICRRACGKQAHADRGQDAAPEKWATNQ